MNLFKKILNFITVGHYFRVRDERKLYNDIIHVMETYYNYAEIVLSYLTEDDEQYKKYWEKYNTYFSQENMSFIRKRSYSDNTLHDITEINREIEEEFGDIPHFKDINRNRNIDQLLE